MNGVCLDLVPADGSKGPYLADCTEHEGAFEIDEIPPGSYVILVNDDGEVTSSEPFKAFYYPNVARREEATVINIGAGEFVEDIRIYAPVTAETVTAEGLLLYADGKPVAGAWVAFKAGEGGGGREGSRPDARAETDSRGRFSIKLLKGAEGRLWGGMYTYVGEFENCPKLESIIRETGNSSAEVTTPALEIRAEGDLTGIEFKYPFPSCKKAKD